MTQSARGNDFERALGERHSELSDERKRLAVLTKSLTAEQERGLILEQHIREIEAERDAKVAEIARAVGCSWKRPGPRRPSMRLGPPNRHPPRMRSCGCASGSWPIRSWPREASRRRIIGRNPAPIRPKEFRQAQAPSCNSISDRAVGLREPGLPGGGMTGVVPGSGTGAGTFMSGVASTGGRMMPSLRCSLSLRVDPVSDGSIFSAGTSFGAGMLGACCGKVGDLCQGTRAAKRQNTDGDRQTLHGAAPLERRTGPFWLGSGLMRLPGGAAAPCRDRGAAVSV